MAKCANQKMKILYLYRILTEETDVGSPLGVSQLISRLGEYGITAERKSIYDDIAALREFGVDVQRTSERSVRYYVEKVHLLEPSELRTVFYALQSSPLLPRRRSSALIRRLSALAPETDVAACARQIKYDTDNRRIRAVSQGALPVVDALASAMASNKKVSLRYDGGEPITVSPWRLTYDGSEYRLYVYDAQAACAKCLSVCRITSVKQTADKREGLRVFNKTDLSSLGDE